MVLGITGISGAGKHTAAEFFRKHGWVIYDADTVAHYLYRPYTHLWKGIVDRFGEGILKQDDTIDRQKLGALVFDAAHPEHNAKALADLNALVHPSVKSYLTNEVHRYFHRQVSIAVVGALWDAVDFRSFCDKLMLIKADPPVNRERILRRDGITREVYEKRVETQREPIDPDFIVMNSGGFDEFHRALGATGIV